MDQANDLIDRVHAARAAGQVLAFQGHGSKTGLLPPCRAEVLSTAEHTGIVDYQPTELVVTARAGTSLRDLSLSISQDRLMLASDPPMFAGEGTVGGAVAAGLSGPSRPFWGALRDHVLGVRMVNGQGEDLAFGGQVMKNVAGYDVSRLTCGAWGALGLLLEVSLRLQPKPEHEATLTFEFSAEQAIEQCRAMARRPLPVSAACWHDGLLRVRLSGTETGVKQALSVLGGESSVELGFWADWRDHRAGFFHPTELSDRQLFRVVTAPAAPMPESGLVAFDWAGGVRWLSVDQPSVVADYVAAVGGWSWPLGGYQQLDENALNLMHEIKRAFDPDRIFVSPLWSQDSQAEQGG